MSSFPLLCVFATSSDTPLDLKIKASMISDMLSLVGEFLICHLIPSPLYHFILHLYSLSVHAS